MADKITTKPEAEIDSVESVTKELSAVTASLLVLDEAPETWIDEQLVSVRKAKSIATERHETRPGMISVYDMIAETEAEMTKTPETVVARRRVVLSASKDILTARKLAIDFVLDARI